METTTYLDIQNYIILQDSEGYRFSQDTVLLANLAKIREGDLAIDLGCGSGVLATLAVVKKGAAGAFGIDISPDEIDRAMRGTAINGLKDRLTFACGDVKDIRTLTCAGRYDVALCNPPYYIGGKASLANSSRQTARHEGDASLADFAAAAAYALKNRGEAWFVIKMERLAEMMAAMISAGLEPKHMTMIKPKPFYEPDVAVIRAIKGGGRGLKTSTFVCMNEDGSYTDAYNALYSEKGAK